MTFALQAQGIRKSFGGVEVLHGVDLDAVGGSVLALLGENGAGKSTLVKIIAGDYTPDAGAIVVDEASYPSLTPIAARDLGVAIIFQEFQDAPTLTVAENISLGRIPNRFGVVDWRAVNRRARKILDELEVDIDPARRVSTLRVGERQIIEIARALSRSARLLILDEPTAALSHHEADTLFQFIRRLRNQGVAIIYITHRLDEVTTIADRVQVLRDGNVALLADVAATDRAAMIEAMVGSADLGDPAPTDPDPRGLRGNRSSAGRTRTRATPSTTSRSASTAARSSPIYGKLGSGAAEVGETAYGLRPITAGTMELEGKVADISGPAAGVASGVGFLPADRKAGGGFMVRPVSENVAVASWGRLATLGQLITRRVRSRRPIGAGTTSCRSARATIPVRRWAHCRAATSRRCCSPAGSNGAVGVLVLIEPTRGVDVGARQDIYKALRVLSADGVAVLISTSDYEEAVQVADRVYVMSRGVDRGRSVGRRDHDDAAACRSGRVNQVTDQDPGTTVAAASPLR